MADIVLELDFTPYDLVVEWPYIYVVGLEYTASPVNYKQVVAKYQVRTNSIDLIERVNHLDQTNACSYMGISFGNFSSGYLFVCGYQKVGTVNYAVVRKVNKNDLSDIAWTNTQSNPNDFSQPCSWQSVKEDSSGIIFTTGNHTNSGGGVSSGWISRINVAGVKTHAVWGIYSTLQNILDFVSDGGTDWVDVTGSYGGYRFIYRYRRSDLNWTDDLVHKYGQLIPGNLYLWYKGIVNWEGGVPYYYIAGKFGAVVYEYQQSTIKINRNNWSLGYPNANVWDNLRNNRTGWSEEWDRVCVTDGSYIYSIGEFYNAGWPYSPSHELTTFRKISLGGVQQWAVNYSAEYKIGYQAFEQYGDYLIAGMYNNGATHLFPKGWIEFRLKSNGAIATYPVTGIGPSIGLSVSSLVNSCYYSEDAPMQTFEIWNDGSETLNYTISDNADWLGCVPSSGDSTGEHDTINVVYNSENLDPSYVPYNAVITIEAVGAENTPQTISVDLTIMWPTLAMIMRHLKWFVDGLKRACFLGWR